MRLSAGEALQVDVEARRLRAPDEPVREVWGIETAVGEASARHATVPALTENEAEGAKRGNSKAASGDGNGGVKRMGLRRKVWGEQGKGKFAGLS